jgi:hypothetical protein
MFSEIEAQAPEKCVRGNENAPMVLKTFLSEIASITRQLGLQEMPQSLRGQTNIR